MDLPLPESGPKRKRAAAACMSCRKRKVRCDGKIPCGHCYLRNESRTCTFSQSKRRRSPRVDTASSPAAAASGHESGNREDHAIVGPLSGLSPEYYINIFLERTGGFFGLITSEMLRDLEPSNARMLQRLGVVAVGSRRCGHYSVASNLEQQLRELAAAVFDDFSFDAAIAFALLGHYYWGVDFVRSRHMYGMALSLVDAAALDTTVPSAFATAFHDLCREELGGEPEHTAGLIVARDKTAVTGAVQGTLSFVDEAGSVPTLPDIVPVAGDEPRVGKMRALVVRYCGVLRHHYHELIRDFPRMNPFLPLYASVEGFAPPKPRTVAAHQVLCLNRANFVAVLELHQRLYRSMVFLPLGPSSMVHHALFLAMEALMYCAIGVPQKAYENATASQCFLLQAGQSVSFWPRPTLRALTIQAAVFYELGQWDALEKGVALTRGLAQSFPEAGLRLSLQMDLAMERSRGIGNGTASALGGAAGPGAAPGAAAGGAEGDTKPMDGVAHTDGAANGHTSAGDAGGDTLPAALTKSPVVAGPLGAAQLTTSPLRQHASRTLGRDSYDSGAGECAGSGLGLVANGNGNGNGVAGGDHAADATAADMPAALPAHHNGCACVRRDDGTSKDNKPVCGLGLHAPAPVPAVNGCGASGEPCGGCHTSACPPPRERLPALNLFGHAAPHVLPSSGRPSPRTPATGGRHERGSPLPWSPRTPRPPVLTPSPWHTGDGDADGERVRRTPPSRSSSTARRLQVSAEALDSREAATHTDAMLLVDLARSPVPSPSPQALPTTPFPTRLTPLQQQHHHQQQPASPHQAQLPPPPPQPHTLPPRLSPTRTASSPLPLPATRLSPVPHFLPQRLAFATATATAAPVAVNATPTTTAASAEPSVSDSSSSNHTPDHTQQLNGTTGGAKAAVFPTDVKTEAVDAVVDMLVAPPQ